MFAETVISFAELKQYLPLIIPLVVIELILLIYVLWHINTHDTYKTGNRVLWNVVALVGMNFVGPILYLIIGKEDA
ncbi:MAG: PLDc N-terminal domain-containing protein [Lachnospiraceae bacterium]|nr:PLDc N-terminal domain-containing protein [Lachnospiraceae bacterium]